MDTHDQAADSQHVVGVGEADQAHSGQVMDKHDHEVLQLKRREERRSEIHAYISL